MGQDDPFTGTWKFEVDKSRLSTPPPQNWIQEIKVMADQVQVRDEVSRANGSTSVWTVRANFDGKDYPVCGSALADTIAYSRDGACIIGVAKKSGAVSLQEIIVVSPDGSHMTLTYWVLTGTKELANGMAEFEKVQP
jgi:hypothetical protein